MRRHIPGLHSRQQNAESNLDGLFLVRVERASYRWHRQKSFLELRFIVLEPNGRSGNSIGFFATSVTTPNCSTGIKWTKRLS
jgi:hypothetical protein